MARVADRSLLQRDGRWHYVRRVPSRLTDIDPRGTIRGAEQPPRRSHKNEGGMGAQVKLPIAKP